MNLLVEYQLLNYVNGIDGRRTSRIIDGDPYQSTLNVSFEDWGITMDKTFYCASHNIVGEMWQLHYRCK